MDREAVREFGECYKRVMHAKRAHRYTFFVLREGRSRENEKATIQGINTLEEIVARSRERRHGGQKMY